MDVTVLVPFKNGGNEEWLREALGSIPRSVPRLVLRNDGELAEALNAGVEQAETEFVFRLDADDVLQRDCLEFLASLAWDVDVTYPSLVLTLQDLTPFEVLKAAPYCPNRLLEKNYIPGTSLYRRTAILAVGGYRELPIGEDWDLLVRLQRAGKSFKAVPEAHYIYRQHADARNKRPVADHQQVNDELRREIVGETPELEATWYYQANYATTYWRCLLPARYLPGQAVDHPRVRQVGDDLEFPEHRGAGIWQFPADGARAVVMSEAQEQGIRVLIETDDNYFDLSPLGNPGWVKTLADSKRLGARGAHSLEAHHKIIPWVDGVIVTTPALGKRYAELNGKIYICPNQIDPVDWPIPEKDEGVLRIGWFASPSHRDDAHLIERACEWASKQDGVEILTMGFNPTSWKFKRTHIPWSNDMGVYRKALGQLDIGLAPVKETPWSVCRSDLKLLEYGMADVAAVCSAATPYRNYNGAALQAKNAKEFLHHVQYLVRNPTMAKVLAQENRDYVLENRTVEKNVWRWQEAIHDN